MKVIIQIPCFNESDTLPATVAELPKAIDGVDQIEVLVIDDGSTDGTFEVAKRLGVHHIVRHKRNRGLAAAFQTGINASLRLGADVIVNTDADNQYCGADIAALVAPVVLGDADIVVGDRQTSTLLEFSWIKRMLQRWGSTIIRRIGGVDIPDSVSGFRAFSADVAVGLNILSSFSYTTEMLIHAGYRGLNVISVPVRTNRKTRESRLFRSIPEFIVYSGTTVLRVYTMYHPLRVFCSIGFIFSLVGLMPILRFLFFYLLGDSTGHIQSLVIGGTCLSLGAISMLFGICADVSARNRQLSEMILERLIKLDLEKCLTEFPSDDAPL